MPRIQRPSFRPQESAESLRVSESLRDPSEYDDREGYNPAFLLPDPTLPLPGLGAWAGDAVRFQWKGQQAFVLDYTHFSTVHSTSRRLPILSAVNIDGTAEQTDIERTDVWHYDPRIPKKLLIHSECYGSEQQGFFSRGHQTRREDPNWGDADTATVADADTFHATNAAPQMQKFNGKGWLRIEDHVLHNANKNDMRVSVFTGPVLLDNDPVLFGVKIPVTFWKIVAFIHDRTGELRATAYIADQAAFLGVAPSFVFGAFGNHQVSVERVEALTGLQFGVLNDIDVLREAGRAFSVRLESVDDIMLD